MLKKFWRDVQNLYSRNSIYEISNRLHESVLEYPFIFNESEISSGKKQRLIAQFDQNGIPLNNPYIDVENGDKHYYPITIGQVGLSVYQTFLNTNSETDKKRFLKFADWFMENKTESEDSVHWLTEIQKPEYKVFKPWKSAFAQSRAISILIRAYDITKSEEYLNVINKALNLFYISYDQGGISVKTQNGLFFEEYTASEPTMVLDGHLFSLFAFIDLSKLEEQLPKRINEKSKELLNLGIKSTIETLPEFDLGYWLRFNLCKMDHYPKIDPCTINYMKVLQKQLELLSNFDSSKELSKYSIIIGQYLTIGNYIKSLKVKLTALRKLNRL